jgi:uncharacterized protein
VKVDVRHNEPFTIAQPMPRVTMPRISSNGHEPSGEVTRPQQRILDALAWLESIGIGQANRSIAAFLSDASSRSSAYSNNVSNLRVNGYLEYPGPDIIALSDKGRNAASPIDTPLTSAELHEAIYRKLPRPQSAILRALIKEYPQSLTKGELATEAGASVTSSAFSNNVSALRSIGLIDYPQQGHVIAKPLLFLD